MSDLVLGERALQPIREILDNLVSLVDAREAPMYRLHRRLTGSIERGAARDAGKQADGISSYPTMSMPNFPPMKICFSRLGSTSSYLEYPWELMCMTKRAFCAVAIRLVAS